MGATAQAQWRDANGVPVVNSFDSIVATKSRTYDGGAGTGAQGATTLFTVTGVVLARCYALCATDLASTTGTIEIGISGNTAVLIAQTTATAVDAGEMWMDATPANGDQLSATPRIINAANIIETIATADITGGALTMYCLWRPISETGNVVAA